MPLSPTPPVLLSPFCAIRVVADAGVRSPPIQILNEICDMSQAMECRIMFTVMDPIKLNLKNIESSMFISKDIYPRVRFEWSSKNNSQPGDHLAENQFHTRKPSRGHPKKSTRRPTTISIGIPQMFDHICPKWLTTMCNVPSLKLIVHAKSISRTISENNSGRGYHSDDHLGN